MLTLYWLTSDEWIPFIALAARANRSMIYDSTFGVYATDIDTRINAFVILAALPGITF